MIDTNNFVGHRDKLRNSALVSAQGTRTVKTALTGSVLSSIKSGDDMDKKTSGGVRIKFRNPKSD